MSAASYFPLAAGRPSRYIDVVLVGAIVAIVALMIVPLPAWMIDLLVAVNISGGVLLLL